MEDMDRSVLGDAWRWLPNKTRCMLLSISTGLAQLAVSAQEQDESSPNMPAIAPELPSPENQVADTNINPLFMATELDDITARRMCDSSAAAAAVASVPQTLHRMAQQLADSCITVCSPLLTAMEIVNLGKTVSEPSAESAHLMDTGLAADFLSTGFSADLFSTGSTGNYLGSSPCESADTYLYMLLMRAYLAAGMAATVCDQAWLRIHGLAAGSGSLSGDAALPIDLLGVQPPTQARLPPPAMGLLSSVVGISHAAVRLSWIAALGDVAFWQEAAYIMSSQGHTACWSKVLRAPLFAALVLLQLIAALSRVRG